MRSYWLTCKGYATVADQFVLSIPHDAAIYLPALNDNYARTAGKSLPQGRTLPQGLQLSDLAFWTGQSALWNHKVLLHSIGGHSVGSDTRGMLFSRSPGSFTLLGDSGGFQIGKGTLQGLKGFKPRMTAQEAVNAWAENFDAKLWIIDWLERYADYAMTIDMPLWARTKDGSASPFHRCSTEQLIAMTVENLQIIEDNSQGRTKWLNVVQGTTAEDTLLWWNSIKWFRYGGWALAGAAGWRGGLANLLTTVLIMRDDGAFSPGQDWLHVLGVSQPKWDVLLTAIQQGLRAVNPRLQISFDSATALFKAGKKDEYITPVNLGPSLADWRFRFEMLPSLRSHADRNNPIPSPLHSPVGQQLMMHDLVVRDGEFDGRRLDNVSAQLLCNHNIWVILQTSKRANAMAFGGARDQLPTLLADVLGVIEQLFCTANWRAVLDQHRSLLDAIAKTRY